MKELVFVLMGDINANRLKIQTTKFLQLPQDGVVDVEMLKLYFPPDTS